jgi:hypothetical protein
VSRFRQRLTTARRGPLPSRRPSRASWQLTNFPHLRLCLLHSLFWPRRLRPFRSRLSPKLVIGIASMSRSPNTATDIKLFLVFFAFMNSSQREKLVAPALHCCRFLDIYPGEPFLGNNPCAMRKWGFRRDIRESRRQMVRMNVSARYDSGPLALVSPIC